MSERLYSRREFLNQKVVETACEAVSGLAIVKLAIDGSRDRLVTYGVESESKLNDMPNFPEIKKQIQESQSFITPLSQQVNQLQYYWREAYYKSRLVPVIQTDSKGRTTITYRTEYYWDEPRELIYQGIDHNIISDLSHFFEKLNGNLDILNSSAAEIFDLSKGEGNLFYPQTAVNMGGRRIASIAEYATVGAGYVFYEEISSAIAKSRGSEPLINDQIRVKRRSFLKLSAAIPLSLVINRLQNKFALKFSSELSDIRLNTRQVISQLDSDDTTAFERYFQTSPLEIRNKIEKLSAVSQTAIQSYSPNYDRDWPAIAACFSQTGTQSQISLNIFNQQFIDLAIPPGLLSAAKYHWATREIAGFAKRKTSFLKLDHFVCASALAGMLAAWTIVSENAILPLTDSLAKKSNF